MTRWRNKFVQVLKTHPDDGLIQINTGDREMDVGCEIDSSNSGQQSIISLKNIYVSWALGCSGSSKLLKQKKKGWVACVPVDRVIQSFFKDKADNNDGIDLYGYSCLFQSVMV